MKPRLCSTLTLFMLWNKCLESRFGFCEKTILNFGQSLSFCMGWIYSKVEGFSSMRSFPVLGQICTRVTCVVAPDPHSFFWIGIRFKAGKTDPLKRRNFKFWNSGCSLLRDKDFYSLGVLYGGVGIRKLQFSDLKKCWNIFSAVFFSNFFIYKNPDPKCWFRIRFETNSDPQYCVPYNTDIWISLSDKEECVPIESGMVHP